MKIVLCNKSYFVNDEDLMGSGLQPTFMSISDVNVKDLEKAQVVVFENFSDFNRIINALTILHFKVILIGKRASNGMIVPFESQFGELIGTHHTMSYTDVLVGKANQVEKHSDLDRFHSQYSHSSTGNDLKENHVEENKDGDSSYGYDI